MAEPIVNQLDVERTTAPMILVIGQTGAGKSHFCNRVMGENVDEVEESAHLSSCTSKPQLVPVRVDDQEYLLVDTPGFNDTWKDLKRSDARILGEIAQTLTLQSQLGINLRGILYLYDITAKRMTGETRRQLELVKRICGERNYENVLLVTTHWPEHIEAQQKQHCAVREGDLRRDFWTAMIRGGSTMCRFDDTHGTAKAIVRRLSGKANITLQLQHELTHRSSLKSTTAFSFIVNARKKDEEKFRSASPADDADSSDIEGVVIRKEGEESLNDDIVARIKREIKKEEATAREQQGRVSVLHLIRWIIGLAGVAMGAAQVGLSSD